MTMDARDKLIRRLRDAVQWEIDGGNGGSLTDMMTEAAAMLEADRPQVAERDALIRELTFTLREADGLFGFFGGEQGEVTVRLMPEGAVPDDPGDPVGEGPSPAGLWAYMTEYPEEGAVFLGASDPVEDYSVPAERDAMWDKTLKERDDLHDMADALADAISKHFGAEIGEHSSGNCPWQNALAIIREADGRPAAASPERGSVTLIPNDSREAFEETLRMETGFVPFDLSKTNGRYLNDAINDRWQSWQSALAWADSASSGRERELRIVFDGPPGPDGPRFIEVEDADGKSVNAGEWRRRGDGLWELVIARASSGQAVPREPISTAPVGAQQESSDDDDSTHSGGRQQGGSGDDAGRSGQREDGRGTDSAGGVRGQDVPRQGAGDATGGGRLPLAFGNDWLRKRIASDPDDEPSAGNPAGREEPK